MDNLLPPSSFDELPSEESYEEITPPKDFSPYDHFSSGRTRFFLLLLACGVGIGGLYWLQHDLGVSAAVVFAYSALYWAFRKTQRVEKKSRYPVIRYRGHPTRKSGFFS